MVNEPRWNTPMLSVYVTKACPGGKQLYQNPSDLGKGEQAAGISSRFPKMHFIKIKNSFARNC